MCVNVCVHNADPSIAVMRPSIQVYQFQWDTFFRSKITKNSVRKNSHDTRPLQKLARVRETVLLQKNAKGPDPTAKGNRFYSGAVRIDYVGSSMARDQNWDRVDY